MKILAKLLKPLDGNPEGSEIEYDQQDFDALEAMHAVKRVAKKAEPAPSNKVATPPANKGAK